MKLKIEDIIHTSLILSLYLIVRFINGLVNVDVLPGIKLQITPLILIVASLCFGPWKTFAAGFIYVFIIAWINPTNFISGITWVPQENAANIFGEYMLDYVIPILSVSIIPGLDKYIKVKNSYFITLSIGIFIKLVSHIIAGIIFWGGYAGSAFGSAWTGYIWSYSILANLLGISLFMPLAFLAAYPSVNSLRPIIRKASNEKYNSSISK